MKEKKDFKTRILDLISDNRSNSEIISIIRAEFRIYLSEEQVQRYQNKIFTNKIVEDTNYFKDIILKILKSENKPLTARSIRIIIYKNFSNVKISTREVRHILWRHLLDQIEYDRNTYYYSLKKNDDSIEKVDVLDFFQIKTDIDLKLITRNFIQRDDTFLNTGIKTVDKLINSFVHDGESSSIDLLFVERKLREHNLSSKTINAKSLIRLKNFHKIEDFIHIIYEDHVIEDYELEYIKFKMDSNGIPELIGNKRFWQVSLFYYYNDLKNIKEFISLIKLVYILLHIDNKSIGEKIYSFQFIDIYKSNNISNVVRHGYLFLCEKLNEILNQNNFSSSLDSHEIASMLSKINDVDSVTLGNKTNSVVDKLISKTASNDKEDLVVSLEKSTESNDLSLSSILNDLNNEDSNYIITNIENGNRLSAFFRYSNCVADKYKKKQIEEYFEFIKDNFS